MRKSKHMIFIIALSILWLTACGSQKDEPGANADGQLSSESQAPRVSSVVPFGEPEIRDLQPTIEVVSNCSGITEPIVKHPSLSTASSNSVEWEIGGSVGVGLDIGSDLAPAKVSLEAALEGRVARDLTNSIQQGNAWDLPAEPGYIKEYTIMWREVWQPGYIDATFFDPEPDILRINVAYRTGVQSEIIGENATRCSETPEIAEEPPVQQATLSAPPSPATETGLSETIPPANTIGWQLNPELPQARDYNGWISNEDSKEFRSGIWTENVEVSVTESQLLLIFGGLARVPSVGELGTKTTCFLIASRGPLDLSLDLMSARLEVHNVGSTALSSEWSATKVEVLQNEYPSTCGEGVDVLLGN